MTFKIINKLHEIEIAENITILMAVEAGSRAYGCPGPLSDYDVRFIYKHNRDDYLKVLDTPNDVITSTNDFDMTGFDIRKVLLLLNKSNISLLDWIYSPICYLGATFKEMLKELANDTFQIPYMLKAYYGLMQSYINSFHTVKTQLNTLRVAIQVAWLLKNKCIAPVDFETLLTLDHIPTEVKQEVRELIYLKENGNGSSPYKLKTDFCKKTQEILTQHETDIVILSAKEKERRRKSSITIALT